MRIHRLLTGVVLLGCGSAQRSAREASIPRGEVRVWTARALATVLAEVGPEFERTSGFRLRVVSDLPPGFARRATAGEPFDLLITGSATVNEWVRAGRVVGATRTDLARSAAPAERWYLGRELRDAAVGKDGAVWLLVDEIYGGLFRLTPTHR